MSNTSITNVEITDTFQVWINKTNELIGLANENIMLAGPGAGFTIQGNSTLSGTFTANMLISSNGSIDSLNIANLERISDPDEQILSASPIKIETSVENLFDLQTSSGNRPILRMINGGNSRWVLGQTTPSASSSFAIRTEGSSTPQVTITQGGRLTVTELQGDGSLITGISVNNISGTLDPNQIPNLDANKITDGTFSTDRIPNLDANKITTGTLIQSVIPLLDTSKIPDLNANKITTGTLDDGVIPTTVVRTSRRLIEGAGISIGGSGTLEFDRTISVVQLSQAQVTNSSDTTVGAVSGQRLAQSIEQNVDTEKVLSETANASESAIGTYAMLRNDAEIGAVFGAERSGDLLVPAAANGESGQGNYLTGTTWKCMGNTSGVPGGFPDEQRTTLWLRIS